MGQKNAGRNNSQMFIMDDENLYIQEAQGSPSMRIIEKDTKVHLHQIAQSQ